jgi:hypothetical protein
MNKQIFEKLERFFGQFQLSVLAPGRGLWVVDSSPKSLPYLRHENAAGNHIFIRAGPEVEGFFMLVDDIDEARLYQDHMRNGRWKPGRLVVETSPGNHQVWIHTTRALPLGEKRFWLKKLDNDPGADPNGRWGRCPGFRNRKGKYRDANGGYPLSRLLWIDWRGRAEIPVVEIPCDPQEHIRREQPIRSDPPGTGPPSGGVSRDRYDKGDESATDFAFALALLRRGFSAEEVSQRIRTERTNWDNHPGERRISGYIRRTVERAQALLDGGNARQNNG